MNVNCVNIGGRSLNITNMNLLIRFNKTREIFPSVTLVLSILLTISAISANVKRASFKGRSLVLSDFRGESKDFWFESSCHLCAEVSSLQQ